MGHSIRPAMLTLVICFLAGETAFATTYYIAANGSDSNNGTSKTTPWLHAPGMPNCAGTCASKTPQIGDQFIFRGGDSWHYNTGTPLIGGTWSWTWSGSSGSPIYIGVDQTWFSGASFTRPILNLDNPTSTSLVASCSVHNYDGFTAVSMAPVNYVTFDDFEMLGFCTDGTSNSIYIYRAGTNIIVENCYLHGWTETGGTGHDAIFMFYGANAVTNTNNAIVGNVIDGSDSFCTSSNNCIGWTLYWDAPDVHKNVIRYVANGFNCPGNLGTIHDNWFDHIYESIDSAVHTGWIESCGDAPGQPIYIYNNLFTNNDAGVGVWPEPNQANLYIFNNVFYHIGNATNCVMVDGQGIGGMAVNVYLTNNTFDAPCNIRFYGAHAGQEFKGTGIFQNNHYIGYSTQQLSSTYTIDGGAAGTTTITDNGSHIFQSESAANVQGYTPSNYYAPTGGGGATVGTGGNRTSSCSTYSADSALCSGTSAGMRIAVVPRPATGAWDAGAYEFSSSSTSRPNPPTGLAAAVQ